jgi:chromosome segregation ATPase
MSEARWNIVKEKIRKLVSEYKAVKSENTALVQDIHRLGNTLEELKGALERQKNASSNASDVSLLQSQLQRNERMLEKLEKEKEEAYLRIKELEEMHLIKDNTLQVQKNTINELTEQNKLIKLAKEMSVNKTDNHELKIKINELIRDIDRCIDLLND